MSVSKPYRLVFFATRKSDGARLVWVGEKFLSQAKAIERARTWAKVGENLRGVYTSIWVTMDDELIWEWNREQ